MTEFMLDMDNVLSDVRSLQLSALSHAAMISPQVHERTIGPGCYRHYRVSPDRSEPVEPGSYRNIELLEADNIKVTVSNRSDGVMEREAGGTPNLHMVDLFDSLDVSYHAYRRHMERRRIKDKYLEMERRQARMREADRMRDLQLEYRLQQAESDAAQKAQEGEQKLLEAIQQHEQIAQEFEEKRKAEIDEENRRLEEISLQLKKKEEEVRKKHAMIDAIRTSQITFRTLTDVFTTSLVGIDKEFSVQFNTQKKTVQGLVKAFEQLLHNVNAVKEVTQQEVDKAAELCKSMDQMNAEMVEIMQRIQEEIFARLQKEEQQKQEQQKVADEASVPAQDTTDTNQPKTAAQPTVAVQSQSDPYAAFASPESCAFYWDVKTFYEQHQIAVKVLLDDPSMKVYRFNCSKVINTTVNTISAVSREHFVDKFNRLDAFLSGQPAKTGDVAVSINGHPLGRTYCMMLMAKKFVGHADTMISSNAPAAFPFAAIIVALWQKYPEFGKFFLAYLHKECPYLVPIYLPKLKDQPQEEYYKSLGYRYTEGVPENKGQYLKRLTGFARLYAAVVVSSPRRGEPAPHPHGLECGWHWLCNLLNMSPKQDICATLITEFLQTAGALLWANYGKQFAKLLNVIQGPYLPLVHEGGPKARLEGLIAQITAEGRIERPEGMLSPDFW